MRLKATESAVISTDGVMDENRAASYCCGMPAASRTLFQRANSSAMCLPNSSGVEPPTTTPALVSRSLHRRFGQDLIDRLVEPGDDRRRRCHAARTRRTRW